MLRSSSKDRDQAGDGYATESDHDQEGYDPLTLPSGSALPLQPLQPPAQLGELPFRLLATFSGLLELCSLLLELLILVLELTLQRLGAGEQRIAIVAVHDPMLSPPSLEYHAHLHLMERS